MTGYILDVLPLELIIRILAFVGYRDLVTCSQVCRLLHTVVEQNALLQYTIELAISGMQNGPPSAMGHANRLTALRNSQTAWNKLQWTGTKDIPLLQGNLYELSGGIFVQSNHLGGLEFRRLPSHYRGIDEHVWSLDLPDVDLRDFALDPAQDLLVLIARPLLRAGVRNARMEISIHLRSLTTGEEHPLATKPPILLHDVDLRAAILSFMVQVHSDHVAVHFISHGTAPSELVVWNWKTGLILLNTYSTDIMAFAFLTERLILVGGLEDVDSGQLCLFVVDLDSSHSERTDFDAVDYRCAFLYPPCYSWVRPVNFMIRSDPSTNWSPHPSFQVPFSIGPGPRLYIVTIWFMQGEEISPIDLFVLSSTLLDRIESLGDGEKRVFEWGEWGPAGTRMIARASHSHSWVCYVYGAKFITSPGGTRERNPRTLEMWDFNQLGIRRDRPREWSESQDVQWHVGDTTTLSRRVFIDDVRTTLPYRVIRRTLPAPLKGMPIFTEAMCSEDNLILVDPKSRNLRVLTF
ncbi:hypothetical protein PAXINDRAFT_139363 [Paxillus involutus ATCC 200175]|uniref:F-box domain-containing protein n=2 Tax=Paxillus involutus ATCC 200175 TaxID=664439 RepID=A0A0C9TB84_PAXIN|nr:hypothetical protein PAXINDRAFT_139363 [Paxillus involutus ATCC 200175]